MNLDFSYIKESAKTHPNILVFFYFYKNIFSSFAYVVY